MLFQNFKGFLTLGLVLSMVATAFYFYKGVVETGFIQKNNLEQFVVTTENIEIEPTIEISSTKAKVTWETPFESAGKIIYCKDKSDEATCITSTTSFGKKHEVSVSGLSSETQYYYKVGIDGVYYPENSDFYTFSTTEIGYKGNSGTLPNTTNGSSEEEFFNAMKTQNLEYDFNNDGKVTIADIKFKK